MQKPNATKQLALYAMVCCGACILLQSIAAMMPEQFGRLMNARGLELPLPWRILLIVGTLAGIMPMAGVAVWSFLSRTITHTKALTTVILAPVLYVAGNILQSIVRYIGMRISPNTETIGAISITSNAMGFFSALLLAALVLICCAGAIELYITKTPSHGEKEETT